MATTRDQFGIKHIDSSGRLHRTATVTNKLISTAALTSNVITIVTAAAHGLVAGDSVTVSGLSNAAFNARWLIATAPTTTSVTIAFTNANISEIAGDSDAFISNNNYGPALLVTEGNFFQGAHAYAVGDIVISKDAGGAWEHVVTTAGTSASTEPNFPVTATTTVSGTVTFTTRAFTGDIWYYNEGLVHRASALPAVTLADGRLRYFENGRLHRTNGPAVMPASGSAATACQYFINGNEILLADIAKVKFIVTANSPAITATYS